MDHGIVRIELCHVDFFTGQMAFAKSVKLRTKIIKLNELPQTKFEVTRYSHVSGAKVVVLNTPQAYIDSFGQKPGSYRFETRNMQPSTATCSMR